MRNVRSVLKMIPHKEAATTLWLIGNLGAGKTTFVQTLAKDMGITETVQSPTYVLMKKYPVPNPDERLPHGAPRKFKCLVHIDAYRLEGPLEFQALRPDELFADPGNLVVIEWPERVEGALPVPDLVLKFLAEDREGGAISPDERYIDMVHGEGH
ncbi:tRNA (adenosine(37)-N6)-threonylcarbamoyltransferase complex ATPase subunit type 1 TsaE [Candidatus Parcubacteria bacterium]|nr:tRNA (adenosine(37)-N6)-threonylcarbamoyltransferase complex ATPase subunit type 1 TsaE [Candidatus Parcubacteria bacterium]